MVCCSLFCLAFVAFVVFAIFAFVLSRSDADLTLLFWERFGRPVDHLSQKVVWIVGASSGIGKSLALRLAAAQCKIIISARRTGELEKVKEECIKSCNLSESDVLVLPLDVTDYSKHESSLKQILKKFGKLDVVVLNAARYQRGKWETSDIAIDRQLFELNVFSQVGLANLVVKYFVENGGGHVVVTSSAAGKFGSPYSKIYVATKHALHGYFECLRVEHNEKNVKVTMLCPGPVQTEILDNVLTNKIGETENLLEKSFGRDTRMSSERCAHLCAVAVANDLDEVWISKPPVLFVYYFVQYIPTIFRRVYAKFGLAQFKKMVKTNDSLTPRKKE